MHSPTSAHLVAAKRVLRYIKGTLDHGLYFTKGFTTLQGFTDADWDGSPSDRKSISGYCIFFGDNPVSWSAKKQPTVSRSSTEAEYRSLASTTAGVTYIASIDQAADIFTKGLAAPRFEFLKTKLKVLPPLQLAGG
ncbi:uncharacterized protein LOC113312825 [Papaver somniferum]|uniref:uncharacterized protein LOC113312825 n=1 Tax=Papaver somniferum TaxID=3469 RepID=UPI000E701A84|nr:uncharacterized protein LOC113312825 [Papaver somniferum]